MFARRLINSLVMASSTVRRLLHIISHRNGRESHVPCIPSPRDKGSGVPEILIQFGLVRDVCVSVEQGGEGSAPSS